jgi:hypothetical protein
MGQNTTGQFPDETHYLLKGNQLTEVTFTHVGGGSLAISEYGATYDVRNISEIQKPLFGDQWLTFEQDGVTYKATVNKRFKAEKGCLVVDVEE